MAIPSEPPVATGYEVTLRGITDLGQRRDDLTKEKLCAEARHLGRIAFAYRADVIGMEELATAYYEYRKVADPGFSQRWDAIVPVASAKIVNYARSRPHRSPNGPSGSWFGPYPFDEGPTPGDATAVAYLLYDEATEICYIGSTGGFRGRLNRHARDGKRFSSWRAYPCRDRQAAYELEDRLIREHLPYLNKRMGA